MQNFIINITQENFEILKDENAACFIISPNLSSSFKQNFISQAKKVGKICLLSGNQAETDYQTYGADGVILDLSKEEHPAKIIKNFKKSSPKALLGVISRNRRHEAMIISECEPEFIIFKVWNDGFDKSAELLEWYNEFFLIQCAVWPMENLEKSDIQSDFVIVDEAQYHNLSSRKK